MTRWVDAISGRHPVSLAADEPVRIGVLRGDGIGPEVVAAAVGVLEAALAASERTLDLRFDPDPPGGAGGELTEEAAELCKATFAGGGAVLTGPHGGRWVYELRARFDLFCKVSPLMPPPELAPARGPAWPPGQRDVDLLIVREQAGGVYQGRWSESDTRREGRIAEHSFSYSARQVRRILDVAAALARQRRGRLAVVVKRGGIPSISSLWEGLAVERASEAGVEVEVLDIDFAVYELLREPGRFDVVVAPNLFGDVIADAGGLLLGSRGLCFGASFDDARAAVYATNHGSAHDLAGTDRANPAAQILTVATMLRESFGLGREARAIEAALGALWSEGRRTDDLAEPGCLRIGTRELGDRVAELVAAELAAAAPRV